MGERKLDDIIRDLKSHESDIRKAFHWYIKKEETDLSTNITFNGLDGIIAQEDITATTWDFGQDSGCLAVTSQLIIDSWQDENRFRMLFPIADWIRFDKLTRSLGISIQPAFQPWEFIEMSFILSYMNGFQFVPEWDFIVESRLASKPKRTQEGESKAEHEVSVSVRLRRIHRRKAGDKLVFCVYPEPVFTAENALNISDNYFYQSIGNRFKKAWNDYCEEKNKYHLLCNGVLFKDSNDRLLFAGGVQPGDIAAVFEKDHKIVTSGVENGHLPSSNLVAFNLIGEANGYEIEQRGVTLEDLKRCDWAIVCDNTDFVLVGHLIDVPKQKTMQVTTGSEYRFRQVFLKNYIRLKHGDKKTINIPQMIELSDQWFTDDQERKEFALRGLQMKKQRWSDERWQNINIRSSAAELDLKKKRLEIARSFGKFWNLPKSHFMDSIFRGR